MKKHRVLKMILICMTTLVAVLFLASIVYVNDYYHATEQAVEYMKSQDNVNVYELQKNVYVFEPQTEVHTGMIFYPGGKVDYRAYAPLMQACANEGILCVLVKMPFNLAVFDVNAAKGLQEQLPQITDWYLGGHSLGGSMAASYLSKHEDQYKGLVLLGSYSVSDLSQSDLKVLSIFGSEDQVLNRDKYQSNRKNLPDTTSENVLTGGCHAYYGMYGPQKGDGSPTISNQEQIEQTAELIRSMAQNS